MDIKQINIKLAALEAEKIPYQEALEVIEKQARILRGAKIALIAKSYGLAEGDNLTVTNECSQHLLQRGWSEWELDGWREGDTLTFERLRLDRKQYTCTLASGSSASGAFPIAMVQKMRAAYTKLEEVE